MEKATLSVKEDADVLGVSLPTMYDITERADFTCLLRVGRKKLVLRDGFTAWIHHQAAAPKQ